MTEEVLAACGAVGKVVLLGGVGAQQDRRSVLRRWPKHWEEFTNSPRSRAGKGSIPNTDKEYFMVRRWPPRKPSPWLLSRFPFRTGRPTLSLPLAPSGSFLSLSCRSLSSTCPSTPLALPLACIHIPTSSRLLRPAAPSPHSPRLRPKPLGSPSGCARSPAVHPSPPAGIVVQLPVAESRLRCLGFQDKLGAEYSLSDMHLLDAASMHWSQPQVKGDAGPQRSSAAACVVPTRIVAPPPLVRCRALCCTALSPGLVQRRRGDGWWGEGWQLGRGRQGGREAGWEGGREGEEGRC